ncbi:hypothetical protein JOC26_001819 [Sporohalobacter salinus]|nr:hypothetical protein [Sporohalobacter salinus]
MIYLIDLNKNNKKYKIELLIVIWKNRYTLGE